MSTTLAIALASSIATKSSGTDLSPSALLNIEVGIDPTTREWLTKDFLTHIHSELQSDLQLVNESINKHLKTISETINSHIDDIETTDLAARIFGIFVSPLTSLQFYYNRVKSIFSFYRTEPNAFLGYYSDFLTNSRSTYCEVAPELPAMDAVRKMQDDIRWRAIVWNRLSGHCTAVSECWRWLENDVQKAVASSDWRDVGAVQGQESLEKIVSRYPGGGISYNPWDLRQILYGWDPTGVESDFRDMFRVEDAIAEARLFRLAKEAIEASDRATNIISSAEEDISFAESHIDKDPHAAFCRARNALTAKESAKGDLEEAAARAEDLRMADHDKENLSRFLQELESVR